MEGGKGSHHVPVGLSFIRPQVLNIGCKTLVQPQVIPPVQGDQITEPLKGRMMRMNQEPGTRNQTTTFTELKDTVFKQAKYFFPQ